MSKIYGLRKIFSCPYQYLQPEIRNLLSGENVGFSFGSVSMACCVLLCRKLTYVVKVFLKQRGFHGFVDEKARNIKEGGKSVQYGPASYRVQLV